MPSYIVTSAKVAVKPIIPTIAAAIIISALEPWDIHETIAVISRSRISIEDMGAKIFFTRANHFP